MKDFENFITVLAVITTVILLGSVVVACNIAADLREVEEAMEKLRMFKELSK